jgi:hypothetical protein
MVSPVVRVSQRPPERPKMAWAPIGIDCWPISVFAFPNNPQKKQSKLHALQSLCHLILPTKCVGKRDQQMYSSDSSTLGRSRVMVDG